MWCYKDKNIYFKDTSVPKDMIPRITELGGKIVKLQGLTQPIDVVCFKDENALNKENKAFQQRQQLQKRENKLIIPVSLNELNGSMGYDESLPFALWSELPNYNPWSGEGIHPTRYNDKLINEVSVK